MWLFIWLQGPSYFDKFSGGGVWQKGVPNKTDHIGPGIPWSHGQEDPVILPMGSIFQQKPVRMTGRLEKRDQLKIPNTTQILPKSLNPEIPK